MGREYQRGPAPPPTGPGPAWQPSRYPPSLIPPDDEATQNKRPSGIYEALRKTCMVPVKHYFLATILEDGQFTTFTNMTGMPRPVTTTFFDEDLFHRAAQTYRGCAGGGGLEAGDGPLLSPSQGGPPFFPRPNASMSFGSSSPNDTSRRSQRQRRHRLSSSGYGYGYDNMYGDDYLSSPMSPKARKGLNGQRFRGVGGGVNTKDEDDVPVIKAPARKRAIKVADAQELWSFYEQRFKNCQQTACKVIAKAWVKAIAPKKQSHNPYTGKDSTAPAWWPKPWGLGETDKVRHKEPDHLYKKERVYLLNHLLRLIMTPARERSPEIRKLEFGISVRKLEEVTADALAPFYVDGQNPTNTNKKVYVDEIFKVAMMEERYRHGEIDGDAEVYVMADDKPTDGYQSENEDTTPAGSINGGGGGSGGGAGGQGSSSNSNPPLRLSPTTTSAATMTSIPVQNMLQQQPSSAEHSPVSSVPTGTSYLTDMASIRNPPPPPPPSSAYASSHSHPMMHSDLASAAAAAAAANAETPSHGYVDSVTGAQMTLSMPPPLSGMTEMGAGHQPHPHPHPHARPHPHALHHHHGHTQQSHTQQSPRRHSTSLLPSPTEYSTSPSSTIYSAQWPAASTVPTGIAATAGPPPPPLPLPSSSSSIYSFTHGSPTVNTQHQHSPYGTAATAQQGILGVGMQTMSPQTQQHGFLSQAFDSMPHYETASADASIYSRPSLGPHTTSFHAGYSHLGQQAGDGRRLHGTKVGIKTEDLSTGNSMP